MPLGISKSAIRAAKQLTKIHITDELSLAQALAAVKTLRISLALKARPVKNATQPNLNDAAYSALFSACGLADALQLVHRDCWMIKADLSSYYTSFSWAKETYGTFSYKLNGVVYILLRVFFGWRAAPYFCAAFSGELASSLGWVCSRMICRTHP